MRRSQLPEQPTPASVLQGTLVTEVWWGKDENALGGLSGLRRLTLSFMKPLEELIALTQDEHKAASRLWCSPEFVKSWRPWKHWKTGRIESGVEPSAGFVACALAIIRK